MDFLEDPKDLNRRLVHNPMGRFGEAVEQAKAVVFRECLLCLVAFAVLARFSHSEPAVITLIVLVRVASTG